MSRSTPEEIRAWCAKLGERLVRESERLTDEEDLELVVVFNRAEGGVVVVTPTPDDGREDEHAIFERKVKMLGIAMMSEALDGPMQQTREASS